MIVVEKELRKSFDALAEKAWDATVYSEEFYGHTREKLVDIVREAYELGLEAAKTKPCPHLIVDTFFDEQTGLCTRCGREVATPNDSPSNGEPK